MFQNKTTRTTTILQHKGGQDPPSSDTCNFAAQVLQAASSLTVFN